MATRTRRGSGFFLIVPIVGGFLYGLTAGRAIEWTLIGLAVGIALCLIVWLSDRR